LIFTEQYLSVALQYPNDFRENIKLNFSVFFKIEIFLFNLG